MSKERVVPGLVWFLSNQEDFLVDLIVCYNSSFKEWEISVDYKSRSLHPEKPKEHEVFKRIPVTSDLKLFHQFTTQRYACQVLCVLIHLMKPLTLGLANIVQQSNMLQLMMSQVTMDVVPPGMFWVGLSGYWIQFPLQCF